MSAFARLVPLFVPWSRYDATHQGATAHPRRATLISKEVFAMTESQDAGAGTAGGVGGALGAAKVFSSLPPDHPFFSTIGRVAAEAAQLEHTLDLIIWELSGVNPALGSCITGQLLGPAARFNAIKALAACRSLPTDMLKRIETLSNKTNDVHHRRNRFVHDAGYTEGGAHAGQFKSFRQRWEIWYSRGYSGICH